jgi:DNA-binding NarL/FixJ family response regulator
VSSRHLYEVGSLGPVGAAPRVLLADGHDVFRVGLRSLLERRGLRVVGTHASAQLALAECSRELPDVLVLELELLGDRVGETVERLVGRHPSLGVLAVTGSVDDADMVIDALQAGAHGHLRKEAPIEDVEAAVRTIAAGRIWLSQESIGQLLSAVRRRPHAVATEPAASGELSAREAEVLRLLVAGRGNAEIAAELVISFHTVKNHISAILKKLGAENRQQAAVLAVRHGLV